MATTTSDRGSPAATGHFRRDIGFWGLLFVSLGSIIGSGWLLGALTAATIAGPASLISWVIAAVMLALLALVHAELGAAYPVAGGTARFPFFAFGSLAGFGAGWMAWVQAVSIAPVEVEATLSYSAHISWVKDNVTILHTNGTLTPAGLLIASCFMLLFTVVNLVGVKLMSDTNTVAVIWKTIVPLMTVVVLMSLTFHSSNFSAGGGFAPYGAHGIFAALPAGVVFALQGFEQAIQMGGEARNPQRDISRAVIAAMIIGTIVYLLLEVAFIAAIDPANVAHGWANPVGKGDFGPYATLATAAGAGWLATVLYIDAVISPAGTGLVYVATASRLSYAMGHQRALPRRVSWLSRRGVPVSSILLAFVIGEIAFLPFPSWQSLVGLITSATAIMYAFAPVSLHALRLRDPEQVRPYRLPAWRVLAPAAFVSANLIIYWSGYEADWKLGLALVVGLAVFTATRFSLPLEERPALHWRNSAWVWPWLGGLILIGRFGRYGGGNSIPDWWDLLIVIVFALVVYAAAVRLAMSSDDVHSAVRAEERGEYEAPAGAGAD
ncbi:amino acid transporter [Kitasatospora sp. MAP12-15]|uniref:APC family permease n=1 Tax=unclassified Kitasatospora TaxID=2633591 RepID=UPI0024737AF6|nr:APC family permease [Kitasatospora sp. MAP12-44]MDH6115279.1 amino acid transporter [Kitasatospora sp. MAP12-44]